MEGMFLVIRLVGGTKQILVINSFVEQLRENLTFFGSTFSHRKRFTFVEKMLVFLAIRIS